MFYFNPFFMEGSPIGEVMLVEYFEKLNFKVKILTR
jgi:hypothetical protein